MPSSAPERSALGKSRYVRRVLIAVGIALAFVVALYFLQHVARVLLLIFAGVLLSIFLSGLAMFVHHRTPLPRGVALALVVVVLVALAGLVGWLAGPRLADQATQLSERIPEAVDRLRSTLRSYGWGEVVLRQTPSAENFVSGGSDIVGSITGIFSTFLSGLTNFVIIVIIGLYLAANPMLYVNGAAHLVPMSKRERARELLQALGRGLRWWIIGRIASMVVVGLLTAIGLLIAGVPLAFTLGFIAAVFSFVPYIGPIASAVPAMLVALAEGPQLVLYVVLVYFGVQLLESYLITPLIQKRAVELPPALLITAQVLVGVLAGILGVIVATPLTVAVIIIVQMLYVEDILGDNVKVMGTSSK